MDAYKIFAAIFSSMADMNQINYGMPTLIETSTLHECAKLCAELGLDFIEINMNMPQYQLDKIDVEYFKPVGLVILMPCIVTCVL